MGKLKKVGIGFGIVILSLFVLGAIGFYMSPDSEYPDEIDYDKMSNSQLSAMAVDWNYRDLLRNIDNYENHIIFVQGSVSYTQPDLGMITFCEKPTGNDCDSIFIRTNGNYLVDDEINGYVQIERLAETKEKMVLGTSVPSKFIPLVKDIRLICTNC